MSASGDTQVTDTWTDFGEHLGTAQAFNMSYYTEQFKGFLHKLKEPVAVRLLNHLCFAKYMYHVYI